MAINTLIKFLSITYWLFGTIICSTIYFLNRFTNVDVIEEEKTFTKSPNSIAKTEPIMVISELTQIEDAFDEKTEKIAVENEYDINGISKSAVVLFSEVVTEATKAANTSELQTDSDCQRLFKKTNLNVNP